MGFQYRIYNNKRAHFLTLSVVDKIDVFIDDSYRSRIIESLKFCQEKKGLTIFGWCLLPNALFLMVKAVEGRNLSDIIRDFKTHTSKTIIKLISKEKDSYNKLHPFMKAASKSRKGIEFKFWQEGYYPVELYSPGFTYQKLFEIHAYPVKSGLVNKKCDYLYSSTRNYLEMPAIIDVVDIKEVVHSLLAERAIFLRDKMSRLTKAES